jgi:type I restriction enzyme, S subunit
VSEVGIPKLRFPEFEGTWDEIRLGSRFPQIRNGFVGTATPYYEAGGVAYLQGKNIKSGLIDPTGLVEVSKGFHEKQKKSQLKSGDILMVQSGHVGECAVVQRDFDGSNCHALIVLTPCVGEDSRWYKSYFYSSSGRRKIQKFKTGNTIEHILTSDLKPMRLVVPSPTEQQKIADFLGAVDARVGLLRRQRDALRAYKKGMMQRLFSRELRFTKPDGSPFPDWQDILFSELAVRSSDKFDPMASDEYPITIELDNLTSGSGKVSGFGALEDQKSLKSRFQKDDVLFGKLRPYLRKYWFADRVGVCSTEIWVLRAKQAIPAFVFYVIQTEQFIQIANQSSGSKMPRADWSVVGNAVFSTPHPEEQQKIADTLTALDTKIDAVTAQMDAMLRFKKGLLQQMFV